MRRLFSRKLSLRVAVGVLALLAVAEAGVRWAGMVDFPLYDADAVIGYIPKANQHGSFLNRNDWTINAQHMGAEAFVPDPVANLLLVGDSLVWGGNPYKRGERLGPQLQGRIKGKVWPIAAGSWALQNELTYLEINPDVVARVDTIAFVLNNGDLAEPSSWGCTLTHPRERVTVALVYLAKKYVLNWPCEGTPSELQVAKRDPVAMLKIFMQTHADKRVVFFLYPDKEESADVALMQSRLESMAPLLASAGAKEVVFVGRDDRWRSNLKLYRDSIHPTVDGMGVLASIIGDKLGSRGRL